MLNIGEILENYRIVRLLSRRETGNLYQAVDRRSGRPVGVQLFPWSFSGDDRSLQRMWRDVAPLNRLEHPNICRIFRVAHFEGRVFLVTDLLDGSSLDYVIGGKPLASDLLISYAFQIASALEAAHNIGVLHLGLNPDNVFVTSLGVKLLDFGIATPIQSVFSGSQEELKLAFAGAKSFEPGHSFCSYLSPEQNSGMAVDARSDLFAVGCVLYEMATGTPAFVATRNSARPVQFDPESPKKLNEGLPDSLDVVITKAISKDRAQRYQSAKQLIRDLLSMMDVQRLIDIHEFATAERLLLDQLASDPENSRLEKTLRGVEEQLKFLRKSGYIQQLCWQAEEAANSKRYAEAVEIYTRAVNVDPLADATRSRKTPGDEERSKILRNIRAKIDQIRRTADIKELPAWIDPSSAENQGTQRRTLNKDERLQRYRITGLLHTGSECDLYEAQDESTEQRVAVELLPTKADGQAKIAPREDHKLLCRLKHPNLCAVHLIGEHDRNPYVVVDYLEGSYSLESVIDLGVMSVGRRLEITRQVCVGLDYAHRNGLTGLDINPSMVRLTDDGQIKLVDYWLVRPLFPGLGKSSSKLDRWSKYWPPEEWKGERDTTIVNTWAIGVMLYRLFSYRHPFSNADEVELARKIEQDQPQPLSAQLTSCPSGLDEVVGRALAKEPRNRYKSADLMAKDIQSILANLGSTSDGPHSVDRDQNARQSGQHMLGPTKGPASGDVAGSTALFEQEKMESDLVENSPGETTVQHPGEFTRIFQTKLPEQIAPQPSSPPGPAMVPPGGVTRFIRRLEVPSSSANQSSQEPDTDALPRAPEQGLQAPVGRAEVAPQAADQVPEPAQSSEEFAPEQKTYLRQHARSKSEAYTNSAQLEGPVVQESSKPQLSIAPPSGTPQVSELLDRTLDLALAASVQVLTPVEIKALVRLPNSKSLSELLNQSSDTDLSDSVRSHGFGLEFLRDSAGRLKPTDITMRIVAPDFEPAQIEKRVRVRPDRDCECQTFLLTPKHTGILRIQFDVLVDELTVASQALKTQSENSDRLRAPTDPVVVSVPLTIAVRTRRRWVWVSAAAILVVAVAVPILLEHRSATATAHIAASRGLQPELSKSLSEAPIAGKNYALLFATDDYQYWPHLNNPLSDAHVIASELRDNYGYTDIQPQVIANPRTEEIVDVLHDYASRSYGPGDQLFIYFAGHGFFDEKEKEGFLVGTDSRLQSDDTSHSSYLDFSRLSRMLDSIPVQHLFVVLDVCYGGAFDERVTKWSGQRGDEYADVEPEKFIQRKLRIKGRLYLTSGQITTVPDGRVGEHSPFARRFISSLRTYGGKKQLLTATEIAEDVGKIEPEPRFGDFGDSAPGANFLFIPK